MLLQQFLHLAAKSEVLAAGLLEKRRERFRRAHLQGFKENFPFSHNSNRFSRSRFGPPSVTRRHFGGNHATGSEDFQSGPAGPESDDRIVRFNQARAKAHCRSTVRGARSRAVAISGTVMPTKYRIRTTSAASRSSSARAARASLTASNSS